MQIYVRLNCLLSYATSLDANFMIIHSMFTNRSNMEISWICIHEYQLNIRYEKKVESI